MKLLVVQFSPVSEVLIHSETGCHSSLVYLLKLCELDIL
jgi:hypothetical protein